MIFLNSSLGLRTLTFPEVMNKPNIMIVDMKFEDLIDQFEVQGNATVTMTELGDIWNWTDAWDAPPTPNIETQLSTDQGCKFLVKWRQLGLLANAFNPGCYWQIELLLEKMGKGEFELAEADRIHIEPYVPDIGHIYAATFSVGGRKIPAGVYRPVVMINFRMPDTFADTWMPVAGFAEFPPIQFYED